jgi:proline dehydrogenase
VKLSAFIPIVRGSLLYLSRQSWLRRWMETSSFSRPLTSRFVAGLTLDDGLRVCGQLQAEGIMSSLDHLGENVKSLDEATASRDAYLEALARVEAGSYPVTVSMKVTALGLDIGEQACLENTEALVRRAREIGSRIEMDMEASAYTDRTLGLVRAMHAKYGRVRAVIQAYLYRSAADIDNLCQLGVPVRLCKGAYKESADIAFASKRDVDANYLKLMRMLFDRGAYPAIASHDEVIVNEAIRYVRDKKIAPERFEFQMLYGVRRTLQKRLVSEGYRLRVYVPYGAAWYPYFMRRLAERPANLMFLGRSLVRG